MLTLFLYYSMIKNLFFLLFFISFYNYYAFTSYEGIQMPNSSYNLLTSNSLYSFEKNIILNKKHPRQISYNLIIYPQDINLASIKYYTQFKNYHINSHITAINYGDFVDSESGYIFSSQDFILENNLLMKIHNSIHFSSTFRFINSTIDHYNSNAVSLSGNFIYNYQDFLLDIFFNDYGIILDNYSDYSESLPTSYGVHFIYSLRYINSLFLLGYESFDDYNIINIHNELFFLEKASISMGYSSIAQGLYSNNFNTDFFTGVSASINIYYKTYFFSIAIKNLGPIGFVNSLSLVKSFN